MLVLIGFCYVIFRKCVVCLIFFWFSGSCMNVLFDDIFLMWLCIILNFGILNLIWFVGVGSFVFISLILVGDMCIIWMCFELLLSVSMVFRLVFLYLICLCIFDCLRFFRKLIILLENWLVLVISELDVLFMVLVIFCVNLFVVKMLWIFFRIFLVF